MSQSENIAPARHGPAVLGHGDFFGVGRRMEAKSASIALVDACPHVERHIHSDAHFIFILDGDYLSAASPESDPQRSGQALFNPPGTEHQDSFNGPGTLLAASIEESVYRDLLALAPCAERPTILPPPVAALMRAIWVEMRAPDPASPQVVDCVALELLASVARIKDGQCRSGPPWLGKVRERLSDEVLHPPSIFELARFEQIHPVYFARTFRRHFGCSPSEFSRRWRMVRAMRLLLHSKMPVVEVAMQCGFFDQSHFANAFRAITGVTPMIFRRRTN